MQQDAMPPGRPEGEPGYRDYVRSYFARDAVTYDRRERLRRRMRTMLVQAAGVRPGDTALDVCTGTGEVALALAAAGARVTGIDLSPDMLAHARRKDAGGQAHFTVGDASALPFADQSFDLCTLSMGLHCMPREVRVAVLKEMARVARRRVALMEPNTPRLAAGRWALATLGRVQRSPRYWPDFVATGLDGALAAAGLELERRVVFNWGVHMVLTCRPTGTGEVAGRAAGRPGS